MHASFTLWQVRAHLLIILLSYLMQLSEGESLDVHFEFVPDSFSTGPLLASPRPLSPIRCAAECTNIDNCAAYNIKDGMCQLLPLSVEPLLADTNSSYYRNKYHNTTFYPVTNKYYSDISQDKVPWPTAVAICKSRGQHLMEIRNQTEQDQLWELPNVTNIWLGMYRQSSDLYDVVYKTDGAALTYNNWNDNEPNKKPANSDANCIATYRLQDFHWFDAPCNGGKKFVCAVL